MLHGHAHVPEELSEVSTSSRGERILELSAVVLLGASEAAFHRWVHDDDGPSYEELSAEALDVALGEFLPRPS